jgi:hypothetical protein
MNFVSMVKCIYCHPFINSSNSSAFSLPLTSVPSSRLKPSVGDSKSRRHYRQCKFWRCILMINDE